MPKCLVCEKETKSLCGRCQAVAFCSADCQKSVWKEHKKSCVPNVKVHQSTKNNPLAGKTKEELSELLRGMNHGMAPAKPRMNHGMAPAKPPPGGSSSAAATKRRRWM